MGYIEKRAGNDRARFRDPLGRVRSKTFARKAGAERYGHLFPELDEAIAASFGEAFTAARARPGETVIHAAFGSGGGDA